MFTKHLRQWLRQMVMINEMPSDLVLVRHGESEGNVAVALSKKGDDRWFEDPAFLGRHSSLWRLTDLGRLQAQVAGLWINNHILPGLPNRVFARQYSSSYIRAMETAGCLGLAGNWFASFYLRERDWGMWDVMSRRERAERFAPELERMRVGGPMAAPPNGESMMQLCLRVDKVNGTLARECPREAVIIVAHGEVMWSERMLFERMTVERYRELDSSGSPLDRIHNCQILHYTRRNPTTGKLAKYYGWMRSVCPWNEELSRNIWQIIERPRFASEDLLAAVSRVPQIIR